MNEDDNNFNVSRNRSKRLDNFIRSVYDTADHPERIQILNYIDLDDHQ